MGQIEIEEELNHEEGQVAHPRRGDIVLASKILGLGVGIQTLSHREVDNFTIIQTRVWTSGESPDQSTSTSYSPNEVTSWPLPFHPRVNNRDLNQTEDGSQTSSLVSPSVVLAVFKQVTTIQHSRWRHSVRMTNGRSFSGIPMLMSHTLR